MYYLIIFFYVCVILKKFYFFFYGKIFNFKSWFMDLCVFMVNMLFWCKGIRKKMLCMKNNVIGIYLEVLVFV